jgi:hypothetical protein
MGPRWWIRLAAELVVDLVRGQLEKPSPPPVRTKPEITPAQAEAIRAAARRAAQNRSN